MIGKDFVKAYIMLNKIIIYCKNLFFEIYIYFNKDKVIDLESVLDKFDKKTDLLLQELSLENSNLHKLEKIYYLLDEYSIFASNLSVCSKGCSFCCYQDVTMTELEAQYIDKNVNVNRKKPFPLLTMGYSTPCPFLAQDTGKCKIYEYRPFVCRTLYALESASLCETDSEQKIFRHDTGKFNQRLRMKIFDINQTLDVYPIHDIRDFY